jgi:hypothetical protein
MGRGRYLGMQSIIGRNNRTLFIYLNDRMWKRIQGWQVNINQKRVERYWLSQLHKLYLGIVWVLSYFQSS